MHNQRKNIDISRERGRGEREAFSLFRSCVLSAEEKHVMREGLRAAIGRPQAGVSPYPTGNFFWFFSKRSFAVSVLSLVLIVESGFGVARAAERALPGEVLYPVKVNMNEPIIASLKRSDAARAEWEHERVARRLAEAETLAERGELGDAEKNEIEQRLSQNRETLDQIEQRDITDDEFVPVQSEDGTKKTVVRFERQGEKVRAHIEERSAESKEARNDQSDQEENEPIPRGENDSSDGRENFQRANVSSSVKRIDGEMRTISKTKDSESGSRTKSSVTKQVSTDQNIIKENTIQESDTRNASSWENILSNDREPEQD